MATRRSGGRRARTAVRGRARSLARRPPRERRAVAGHRARRSLAWPGALRRVAGGVGGPRILDVQARRGRVDGAPKWAPSPRTEARPGPTWTSRAFCLLPPCARPRSRGMVTALPYLTVVRSRHRWGSRELDCAGDGRFARPE